MIERRRRRQQNTQRAALRTLPLPLLQVTRTQLDLAPLLPSPHIHCSFSGLTPVAGFGFGAPPVVAAAPAAAAAAEAASQWGADEPALTGALDGEVAQCLRHLSKKDATTKLKALAALRELCASKQPADLAAALPPWAYHFQRLTSDAAKPVRCEALAAMAALATTVGRALAPSLKTLLPPWWLAACDPYADVAAAARRSLAEAFPGQKQTAALVLCRCVVLSVAYVDAL